MLQSLFTELEARRDPNLDLLLDQTKQRLEHQFELLQTIQHESQTIETIHSACVDLTSTTSKLASENLIKQQAQ